MTALGPDEVRRLCGDIPDWKIVNIIAKDPTIEELEVALAWAAGESDIMGKERHSLSGKTAELYDILVADEEWDEEQGTTL
jgi:hypothetical protein